MMLVLWWAACSIIVVAIYTGVVQHVCHMCPPCRCKALVELHLINGTLAAADLLPESLTCLEVRLHMEQIPAACLPGGCVAGASSSVNACAVCVSEPHWGCVRPGVCCDLVHRVACGADVSRS
jgi:hypothetical protein